MRFRFTPRLRIAAAGALTVATVLALALATYVAPGRTHSAKANAPTGDITTLAGKVASLNGTAGLQIRFSAFIEQEVDEGTAGTIANPPPITPPEGVS